MNKKLSLGTFVGAMILVILITSAIATRITNIQYNNILKGLPEKVERYEALDELDDVIRENYYDKGKNVVDSAMAQGYVTGLSDSSSKYLTASAYEKYLAQTQGQMSGIGIEFEKSPNGNILITSVADTSPASKAGLKVNDVIVAFDGIELDSTNYDDMASKLTGDKLSSVNFTYYRDSKENTINVTKGYEAKSVQTEVYNTTGYIKITNFFKSTAKEVQDAVDMFVKSDVSSLVLDLRKNTSPNFIYAISALDVFVPMTDHTNPAVKIVDSDDKVLKIYETTSGEVNLPTIILTSKTTKAGAELFACSLRDFGKAELLGDGKTAGMGLMQENFELSNGDAVILSTGKIMPFKSENYDNVGLEPDYVVEAGAATTSISKDAQFLQAVTILTSEEE